MKKEVEMITVKVSQMCDVKGCKGEYKPTGMCLTSHPAKYPHVCTICRDTQTFLTKYPAISYNEKGRAE